MTIIGLAGYAGAGKDTAADFLVDMRGYKRRAFATPLRTLMQHVNPTVKWTSSYLPWNEVLDTIGYRRAKDETNGRHVMQRLGNGVRATLGEDAWVNAAFTWLDREPHGRYVFTDVRYPNEAQAIKDRGGFILRIDRPGVGPVNDHISESAMDEWEYDGVILNDDDIEHLWLSIGLYHHMFTSELCTLDGRNCPPTHAHVGD